MTPRACGLVVGLCGVLASCDGGGATPPAPSPGNGGLWTGTTFQGAPISFSVSNDEKVTAITIGHDFNGCSGVETFSGLSLETAPDVTCIPGPCAPGIQSYRAFNYGSGPPAGPRTSVNGLFLSATRAEGAAGFQNFPGCGSATGVPWTATKR